MPDFKVVFVYVQECDLKSEHQYNIQAEVSVQQSCKMPIIHF